MASIINVGSGTVSENVLQVINLNIVNCAGKKGKKKSSKIDFRGTPR